MVSVLASMQEVQYLALLCYWKMPRCFFNLIIGVGLLIWYGYLMWNDDVNLDDESNVDLTKLSDKVSLKVSLSLF